jgi:hypothetical protein
LAATALHLFVELLSGDLCVARYLNPEIELVVSLYPGGEPFFGTGRQEELNGVTGRDVRRGSSGKSRHLQTVENPYYRSAGGYTLKSSSQARDRPQNSRAKLVKDTVHR